mmetsp:Transcript_27266/g.85838  ORF Transcript_27266/g.85838 Transcript_27266/m.85838 type:complete len:269 (-) Transcript_27266:659-1465(-)|eukprot:CAMPEP_0118857876 /NCGR_PEP_ID=MMETSP1163-20130328/4787_1 /TAXON_ID=124430 /ORGANISM="Phaeomonas parva, Strain CCMP2877" /LENGTH=268 /DNA_ID=CAMNT_0006791247 /DNA_START=330 /DNA_END=1136 /DNA_ORIENTATION=-
MSPSPEVPGPISPHLDTITDPIMLAQLLRDEARGRRSPPLAPPSPPAPRVLPPADQRRAYESARKPGFGADLRAAVKARLGGKARPAPLLPRRAVAAAGRRTPSPGIEGRHIGALAAGETLSQEMMLQQEQLHNMADAVFFPVTPGSAFGASPSTLPDSTGPSLSARWAQEDRDIAGSLNSVRTISTSSSNDGSTGSSSAAVDRSLRRSNPILVPRPSSESATTWDGSDDDEDVEYDVPLDFYLQRTDLWTAGTGAQALSDEVFEIEM